MEKKKKVILSSPLIFETGKFVSRIITVKEAKKWAVGAENFCGHETVRVIGIKPVKIRKTCTSYKEALVLRVHKRLEFGQEYSVEEILAIGITPFLITKED